MSSPSPPRFQDRIDAVRAKADIVAVVGRVVKLGKGRSPRGQCPFHGSSSDSLSVAAAPKRGEPFVHCFGCGWHGDVIRFVADFHGIDFRDALARLEAENGLDGMAARPVQRARAPQARRSAGDVAHVESIVVGRTIWKAARPDLDAVRTYLLARGIPIEMLGDERLADFRFLALAPIMSWPQNKGPDSVPRAPAMAALVRRPVDDGGGGRGFVPMGLHVTYLAPDLKSKMVRDKRSGGRFPDRKMFGAALGGAVILGVYGAQAPLFVGEGNETVLSGMALAGAGPEACGIAALSLDNLQGGWRSRGGAIPLHDIQPDPERPALCFAHGGPVTGLIDADMAPLRGPRDPATGAWRGELVIEERGARPIRRAISPAERARICGELFVRSWRAAGCQRVTAIRPPMGMDFNNAVRG